MAHWGEPLDRGVLLALAMKHRAIDLSQGKQADCRRILVAQWNSERVAK